MASIVNQMTQVSWMCGQKKPSFFMLSKRNQFLNTDNDLKWKKRKNVF